MRIRRHEMYRARLRRYVPFIGAICFPRPMVLFQSDDWGLLGIRDREGFEELRSAGLDLGGHPRDFASLETAEDLGRLYEVLSGHRDSIGRSPCVTCNFVLANVDFPEVLSSAPARLFLKPLDRGLPGRWKRPGLREAYREGLERGLLYPAFHGLTHFCRRAAEGALRADDERGRLLRTLYRAETPLIHHLIPWIGFEYRDDSGGDGAGWLDRATQTRLIGEGVGLFQRVFGRAPVSACAPGYRANDDTRQAWAGAGIRVAQNGPSQDLGPHYDRTGLLMLYRNVPFEPALEPDLHTEDHLVARAQEAFRAGKPAVVCTHSVNFHSTLRDYREATLARLDRALASLERAHPDLLYIHDGDILSCVERGGYEHAGQWIPVRPRRRWQLSPAVAHRLAARKASARGG